MACTNKMGMKVYCIRMPLGVDDAVAPGQPRHLSGFAVRGLQEIMEHVGTDSMLGPARVHYTHTGMYSSRGNGVMAD